MNFVHIFVAIERIRLIFSQHFHQNANHFSLKNRLLTSHLNHNHWSASVNVKKRDRTVR